MHSRHTRRTQQRTYWVYILTNRYNGTLYVGITGFLPRRIWQHKTGAMEGFTKQYGLDKLVYFESYADVRWAIAREKEIKGWMRKRKIALIEANNPNWDDLSEGWFDQGWVLRCAQDDRS